MLSCDNFQYLHWNIYNQSNILCPNEKLFVITGCDIKKNEKLVSNNYSSVDKKLEKTFLLVLSHAAAI